MTKDQITIIIQPSCKLEMSSYTRTISFAVIVLLTLTSLATSNPNNFQASSSAELQAEQLEVNYKIWIEGSNSATKILFQELGKEATAITGKEYLPRTGEWLESRNFIYLVFEDYTKRQIVSYWMRYDASSSTWTVPRAIRGGGPKIGIDAEEEVWITTEDFDGTLRAYRYTERGFIESSCDKVLFNGKSLDTKITYLDAAESSEISQAPFSDNSVKATTADWTFMVYLDGDCDLEDAAIDDFNEMAVAGSTTQVNIIVQFDRISGHDTTNGDWTTCKRFRITQGMAPTPANQLSDIGEVNMGDPNVLIDFVKWGIQEYPAKYYMVILWDHGGGWKGGVCIDSTSNDRLYPNELKYAFEEIRKFLGRPLDIVGFDACLMAESAIHYELWHTVDYIIASEETEGWDGWMYGQQPADSDSNYPGICEALKQWPNMTPPEFGRVIVERNIVTPSIDTLSCIDSAKFNYPAAEQFQNLSQKLRHVASTYKSQITTARDNAQAFYYSYMKDIWHLASLLKTNVPDSEVQATAQEFMDAYNASVVKNGNTGGSYANAYGLTVYFDSSYDSGYDALSIAKENRWDEFLKAYFANTNYPNKEPVCTITEPAQGSTVYQTAPITIKGTANDPIDGGSIQSVQVKIDREFWVNATGTTSWQLTWNPADVSEGVHRIFARSFDGTDFSPWAVCEVYVAVDPNLPDLTVTDITFSNPAPYEGDIVIINATIKNVGINLSADNVNVSFYSGDPKAGGVIIDTVNVGTIVANGGTKLASTSWNTTGYVGLNNIYVKADSTDTIAETNELNNTANKTVTVQGYRVELSCPTNRSKVRAGATATYNIKVKNLGTSTDTIILSLTNMNASWNATLSAGSVTLDADSETTVYLNVTAPSDALPDANVTIYVKGTSQGDSKKNSTISTLTIVIPKILLVDDESGTDEQFYKAALDANGYKYDYTAPEQITGWSSVLMQYKIVIWFVSGSSSTLTSTDRQNLMFYLDNGGLLLICGEDIGYDIADESDGFYQNYLHAKYIADDTGIKNLNGVTGDPISDGFSNLAITGSYPSEIAPYDSYGSVVFKYKGSIKNASIKVDTGVYRLVYIACEYFEGPDSAANKSTIMDRIIKWLEPANDVAVKSIDSHIDGNKYPAGLQDITATVINNGRDAQSNFNVSCEVKEILQPEQVTTVFSDGFEVDLSKWTVSPAGKWVRNTTYANSGSYSAKCLYDAHSVNYNLTSQNIDLTGTSNAKFEYYFRGSSENTYDKLFVEIKRTTETTWTALTQYTGTSYESAWTKGSFDISSYAGSTVQIRFRFLTDSSVIEGIGWYVDDVAVSKTVPPVTKVVFSNNQTITTSLAQYATKQVSWNYNFQNTSDYIITVKTWLSNDESKANDAKAIAIKIILKFTFNLDQGWNFITLPLNTSYRYAGELANAITNCQYIRKWDAASQSYITHEKGSTLNNFTLELGVGYFVYVTQPTDFNIEGSAVGKQTLTLSKGWNSIGRFNETAIYASELAKSIGSNCSAIAYYDDALGRFVTHTVGTSLGNFELQRGKGYLVYATGVTAWKNE